MLLSGCGVMPKQSEDEPTGTYKVDVVDQSFPRRHKLAKRSTMEIAVKNADSRAIPNINVALDDIVVPGEAFRDDFNTDPEEPQFVVNRFPHGGQTAYVGTFALGPLNPGQTKIFRFDMTALQPGAFNVGWQVQGGLDGKAKAVQADGSGPVKGRFAGFVKQDAPPARVSAADGESIVRSGKRIGPENR